MIMNTQVTNPYIAGRALGGSQGFCGRDDVLRTVEARLRSNDQGAIVLYGQRRIGKTSILLQLQRRLPSPPFVPVYFDLMDRASQPLGLVLGDIAAILADAAGMPAPNPAQFDDQGHFFSAEFLPALYATLGDERFPVLLLDEFDVLDIAATEQITKSAAAHAFFPYLRRLLESQPRLKFIFVIGRRVEDLSIIVKSLFKTALAQRISVLDHASTQTLVRTAQRLGTLGFSRAAVDRILALTGGHPHLTQLICQILWNSAYDNNPPVPPSIQRVEQVDAAAEKTLEAGENIFEWIWDGLPPAERVIFSAIAAATDEQSVVTVDKLETLLQLHGVRILANKLVLAPRTLVEWEMLREVDGGYRFFIEIMRRWVVARKPLLKVKDELDQLEPQADLLYRAGDTFYRQRDLEGAQGQIRTALRVNPNHLKARLLLGQILLEQDNLEDAVKELEEAYRRDDDQARYILVRALNVCAEARERAGDEDRALAAYDRALTISEREAVSRERRAALLHRRAERLVGEGRLADARRVYEQAGDAEKAASIAQKQAQQALMQEVARAETHERSDEWDQALAIYQRLMESNPADPRWHEAVAHATVERDLFLRYAQGREALGRQDHPLAISALSQVVQARPAYRDAAQLHSQAQEAVAAELRRREEREDWGGAQNLCRELVAEQPEEARWRREIARLAEEQSLSERYAAGAVALGRRAWETATAELDAVVQTRPGYKDAARLLQRAERGRSGAGYITTPGRWWALVIGVSGVVAVALGAVLGPAAGLIPYLGLVCLGSGMCFGLVLGFAQWLALRRRLPGAGWWIPATVVGGMFLPLGPIVGPLAQWLVLRRGTDRAGRWLVVNVLALLAGGGIVLAGIAVSSSSTVSNSTSLTWAVLVALTFVVGVISVQAWALRPVVSPLWWILATLIGGVLGLSASGVTEVSATLPVAAAIVIAGVVWTIGALLLARLLRALHP